MGEHDTDQRRLVFSNLPKLLCGCALFKRTLPTRNRMRVLLGDPPIDWKSVTSPADEDMNDWRDAHFAWVVEREVIRKGHKALLFAGGAHISRKVILPNSLIHLLDARFPKKTLVVSAVDLTRIKPALASRIRTWPVTSATEVRGTWLGNAYVGDIGFALSSGSVQDDVDVVLYLSPMRSQLFRPTSIRTLRSALS